MMENTGGFYFQQGIKFFESGQYEEAVRNLIQAYDLGYEKEQVLADIYNCFIVPNDQEFRNSYRQSSPGFTQLPYEECVLDFIPVSEGYFYIFDKEAQEFLGIFDMEESPVEGEKQTLESILYVDEWDIREILPDMKQKQRAAVYLLPGKYEQKFASFLKVPHFKEYYLGNVIVFPDESIMQHFFERFPDAFLPTEIAAEHSEKYWNLISNLRRYGALR